MQIAVAETHAPAPARVRDSASKTLYGVQGLRFLAACMVVLTHTLNRTLAVFPDAPVRHEPFLESGVDIFFIISGFIMVYILRPETQAFDFWLRRFGRIAPLYWLFTAVAFIGGLVAPAYFLGHIGPGLALKSLIFVPVGPDATFHPAIGPGWTLIYEFGFYTALSICLIFWKRPLLAVSLAILIVLSLGALVPRSFTWLHFYGDEALMVEFVFGIGLALLMRQNSLAPWTGPLIAAVGLTLIYFLWDAPINYPRGLRIGMPAFLVVAGVLVSEPIWPRHKSLLAAAKLGDASYSIYIVHFFMMQLVWTLFDRFTWLKLMGSFGFIAVMMAAGIGAGLLAHHFLERPMLAEVHRRLGRTRDRAAKV